MTQPEKGEVTSVQEGTCRQTRHRDDASSMVKPAKEIDEVGVRHRRL